MIDGKNTFQCMGGIVTPKNCYEEKVPIVRRKSRLTSNEISNTEKIPYCVYKILSYIDITKLLQKN